MNICHVISSIDKNSGGTSTYEQTILSELIKHIPVSLLTIKSNNPIKIDDKVNLFSVKRSFPFLQAYSNELAILLDKLDCDIFHGNGLWQYPVHIMAVKARQRNRPYLISPHGMLDTWALSHKSFKKKIALALYQFKDLSNANCLHALTERELINIRKLNLKNPVAVIPNGIDIMKLRPNFTIRKSENTILFLSRLHPKKGIEMLIEAWANIHKFIRKNWTLKIVGSGKSGYVDKIHQLIVKNFLTNEIKLVGAKYDEDKINELQNADLFVLPSYSEGFPLAVLEALSCALPVITTKGVPFEELISYNAGWWIDIGVEPLVKALTEAMQLSDVERINMGLNGRKLVENNYSIESVVQKMIQLYEWILDKREKPEFIYK